MEFLETFTKFLTALEAFPDERFWPIATIIFMLIHVLGMYVTKD